MKTMFFPVKFRNSISSSELRSISKSLPKKLAIAYSIQYLDFAENLKKELFKNHKILNFIQILGCSKPVFSKEIEGVLIISDGRFHALSLAHEIQKPTYLLERGKLIRISENEAEIIEKKRKAAYVNFLNSSSAGVLISTKPGQEKLSRAFNLKKKFQDKKMYFFISNEINLKEIENFGLSSWINTACPRLDNDNPRIINISEIL